MNKNPTTLTIAFEVARIFVFVATVAYGLFWRFDVRLFVLPFCLFAGLGYLIVKQLGLQKEYMSRSVWDIISKSVWRRIFGIGLMIFGGTIFVGARPVTWDNTTLFTGDWFWLCGFFVLAGLSMFLSDRQMFMDASQRKAG